MSHVDPNSTNKSPNICESMLNSKVILEVSDIQMTIITFQTCLLQYLLKDTFVEKYHPNRGTFFDYHSHEWVKSVESVTINDPSLCGAPGTVTAAPVYF